MAGCQQRVKKKCFGVSHRSGVASRVISPECALASAGSELNFSGREPVMANVQSGIFFAAPRPGLAFIVNPLKTL